jgi:hypothetical protein
MRLLKFIASIFGYTLDDLPYSYTETKGAGGQGQTGVVFEKE